MSSLHGTRASKAAEGPAHLALQTRATRSCPVAAYLSSSADQQVAWLDFQGQGQPGSSARAERWVHLVTDLAWGVSLCLFALQVRPCDLLAASSGRPAATSQPNSSAVA